MTRHDDLWARPGEPVGSYVLGPRVDAGAYPPVHRPDDDDHVVMLLLDLPDEESYATRFKIALGIVARAPHR